MIEIRKTFAHKEALEVDEEIFSSSSETDSDHEKQRNFSAALRHNSVGMELLKKSPISKGELRWSPTPAFVVPSKTNKLPYLEIGKKFNFGNLSPNSKANRSSELTHEALHRDHYLESPADFKKRKLTNGTHPGWTNAEEELTITGRKGTFPDSPVGALSENAARREMNLTPRFSHEGASDGPSCEMTKSEYEEFRGKTGGKPEVLIFLETLPLGLKKPVLSSSQRVKKNALKKRYLGRPNGQFFMPFDGKALENASLFLTTGTSVTTSGKPDNIITCTRRLRILPLGVLLEATG